MEENIEPQPIVSLPFFKGVSQQIAKVRNKVEIRSALKAQPWQWKLCGGIKDVIPKEDRKGVVYEVSRKDCSGQYVGDTPNNGGQNARTFPPLSKRHFKVVFMGIKNQFKVVFN